MILTLSILRRRARTAIVAGPRFWILAGEAAAALLAARLRLWLFPFRRVATRLGTLESAAANDAVDTRLADGQAAIARDIGRAVRTTASIMPFRAVCIEQAIAAQDMLRRRGIGSVLHLGVDHRGIPRMTAHAWLSAGETRVTGYPVAPEHHVVGRFVCHAPPPEEQLKSRA